MTTTRMSALEVAVAGYDTEPALGTLEQRLDIIIRRHGGDTRRKYASRNERRDYLRWLARNDAQATLPYPGLSLSPVVTR
jgi:hypothetical protein